MGERDWADAQSRLFFGARHKATEKAAKEGRMERMHSFLPGQIWLDTEGKRIQAHGGSVFWEKGIYYWYGENKEFTTGDNGIWTYGVRAYRSTDLYNWEDLGLIIPPDLKDRNSPLYPGQMLDRPHILYEEKTGKYVCWVKVMMRDGTQQSTVLTADRFLGPYTIVRTGLQPFGMDAGDFDLAKGEDGKGYYYFEHVHSELICADLTEDFTNVAGTFTRHFPQPHPPLVREAPCHFVRGGKHYLITSGTTGYLPNASLAAVAEDFHGPFTVLGDPHPGDVSHTSFHSQISCVFRVHGKRDLYIACADRWVPDHMDLPAAFYEKAFALQFTGRKDEIPALAADMGLDAEAVRLCFCDAARNTRDADYVWLPLVFEEPDAEHPAGRVRIDWKEEWRLEDYN